MRHDLKLLTGELAGGLFDGIAIGVSLSIVYAALWCVFGG